MFLVHCKCATVVFNLSETLIDSCGWFMVSCRVSYVTGLLSSFIHCLDLMHSLVHNFRTRFSVIYTGFLINVTLGLLFLLHSFQYFDHNNPKPSELSTQTWYCSKRWQKKKKSSFGYNITFILLGEDNPVMHCQKLIPRQRMKKLSYTAQKMIIALSVFVLFSSTNSQTFLNQDIFTWEETLLY